MVAIPNGFRWRVMGRMVESILALHRNTPMTVRRRHSRAGARPWILRLLPSRAADVFSHGLQDSCTSQGSRRASGLRVSHAGCS
jgi:hypothetical protein